MSSEAMPAYTVGAMVKEDDKWHKAVFRVNAASATAARRKVGRALTKAGTPHNLQQVRRVKSFKREQKP